MLAMPAAHRQALRQHYLEFPFGDFRTQQLLAQIIIILHRVNSDSKSKPLEIKDVAPWLVPASERRKRRNKQFAGVRDVIMDMAGGLKP